MQEPTVQVRKIAVIGGYLPRQCGIATFTTDLCEALAAEHPGATVFAMPINDTKEGYDYPERVRFELAQDDIQSYRQAADFLNFMNVDVVCLQHEYGIFGGPAGRYILTLLRELRMPIVTTLHTVLAEPSRDQRLVMEELARLSDRLVVMSARGVEMLQSIYDIPAEKIAFIPHGIPDLSFVDTNFYKDQFKVEGQEVLLTFGLLSENKGIEFVIRAMPEILAQHPNVVYIVLGTTHPHVKRRDGEAYRESLMQLARDLGVEENVIFYNQFVDQQRLIEFVGAADLYITPYLFEAQITSGTLAFTVGSGKAVISTPYWHAQELLDEERGILVPFRDASAIASAVLSVLDNDVERHAMRKRAFLYGREMVWPQVAQSYMQVFQDARTRRTRAPQTNLPLLPQSEGEIAPQLPALQLHHLRRMTDDTGMFQHAIFGIPNYNEGYTTDDNARALIAAILLETLGKQYQHEAEQLSARYLAFLWHASNPEGRFRNFMGYNREWLEEAGSTDSHCRAIWALGTVLGRSHQPSLLGVAAKLFERALPLVGDFAAPRSWAFALLGIHEYMQRFAGDRVAQQLRAKLAEQLLALFQEHQQPEWPWFEDRLTYDNPSLARALLLSGDAMERDDMVEAALTSLTWLAEVQRPNNGHFVPIGCQGFYTRGAERARFDQQPVEAQAMVAAALDAYRVTNDPQWYTEAQRAFAWFLGDNDLHLSLYDPITGGCHDGLQPDGVNRNQGAESTLAFLLSLLDMRLIEEARLSIAETPAQVQPIGENAPLLPDAIDLKNDPFILGPAPASMLDAVPGE